MAAVLAVQDTGGFDAAARRLGLAQSVVSAHVRNFEQWFSYPIFTSGRRARILSLEGEEALRCTRNVLHRYAELSRLSGDIRGAITLKQIETFYWLTKLGNVVRAANKLNITQAAASRRLQDFAARFTEPVFSAQRRTAKLTTFGQRVQTLCEQVLTEFNELKSRRSDAHTPETVVHIGITELVALTWFPAFVQRMKQTYPHVVIHPDVDIAASLQEKLTKRTLDIVVIPQPALTNAMTGVAVGSTSFAWFCAPGTFGNRKRISLYALASKPLLVQGRSSGITMLARELFSSAGLAPRQIFGSNSLVALAGLIESGIGVSCLPRSLFGDLIKQNRLQIIESATPPKAMYYMAFLKQQHSGLYSDMAQVAKESCSF
jgi:DNA-binding transcriptional LysR family regulator